MGQVLLWCQIDGGFGGPHDGAGAAVRLRGRKRG